MFDISSVHIVNLLMSKEWTCQLISKYIMFLDTSICILYSVTVRVVIPVMMYRMEEKLTMGKYRQSWW